MEEWHLFPTLGKRNSEFWHTCKMSESQEEKVRKDPVPEALPFPVDQNTQEYFV